MNFGGDSIEAMQSLFPETEGSSILTSPLQLRFEIISSRTATVAYRRWHYLSDTPFLSQINFGAYFNGRLEGAISFGTPNATELNGYWDRSTQFGWHEIKRLVMSPVCPHNSESRMIGKTISMLRKRCVTLGIVTYADTSQGHVGTIYKASGFKYLGLTDPKNDYWINGKIKQRGKTTNMNGEWRSRPQKHLFVKTFNKK